ncbi:MAG: PQQ-binding-like beta-propeller repeat protein [Treponema sp.]
MKRFPLLLHIILLLSLLPAQAAQTVQPEQSQWSAVMAGETLCDPVLHGAYLYTLSSDHALNCIDYTGSFVWRRTITRTVKPFLSVSESGILLTADSSGLLQAVSSQGIYLWSIWLPEPVVYAPYSTKDGRICVLTQSRLYCLSVRGTIKWQLRLEAPPVRQISETGTASLIVILANKDFLTVSLTGQVLARHAVKKDIAAIAAAPEGYLISTADGVLTYHRSSVNPSDAAKPEGAAVWQVREPPPLFMQELAGKLLCVYADGTVSLRKTRDNTPLWKVKLGSRLTAPLHCTNADGDYYLSCHGFAAAVSAAGSVKREKQIPPTPFLPLVTSSGILIAMEDWVVNSWQLDTKIMTENPLPAAAPVQYHILKTERQSRAVPFFIPYNDTASLLSGIEKDITGGQAGGREAEYAAVLHTILADTEKAAYFPYTFSVHERALAAELLGRLESLEYRALLLDQAGKTADPVLASALIRGLGFIAADPDGKSVDAVELLLRRCGVRETKPAYTACDTLAEIAKYGDSQIAQKAVKALFTIAASAFPENIKLYARQKIKTIVE